MGDFGGEALPFMGLGMTEGRKNGHAGMRRIDADAVCVDEFQRLGAAEWGKAPWTLDPQFAQAPEPGAAEADRRTDQAAGRFGHALGKQAGRGLGQGVQCREVLLGTARGFERAEGVQPGNRLQAGAMGQAPAEEPEGRHAS